jgi:hypothetical protein
VLAILADDIRRSGECRRPAEKIAEMVRCVRKTVLGAVKEAKRVRPAVGVSGSADPCSS